MPVIGKGIESCELVESSRRSQNTHSAGQRPLALVHLNRVGGQLHCGQRRCTRRIERYRRAGQSQAVRDPAGAAQLSHTDGPMPGVGVDLCGAWAVLRHRHSDEAAAEFALDRAGIDPGILQRLPRHPHRHPLLGVHHDGLAMGDAEERRVECRCAVQESAGVADPPPAVQLGHRQQIVDRPAAIAWKGADQLPRLGKRRPQRAGAVDSPGRLDRHSGNDDRVG